MDWFAGLFCDLLVNFNYLITRSANKHTCAIKNWDYVASHQNILANYFFAVYFAINGWFRVFVVATYLSIRLTPKTLHTTVSHQNILANNGDRFFIHRTEIFDFVVRWDEKAYRHRFGKWMEKILWMYDATIGLKLNWRFSFLYSINTTLSVVFLKNLYII